MEFKTPAAFLQELMVKHGQVPEYELINQSGPAHQQLFQYRCAALGVEVFASARSKKDAKQEAAKKMLSELSQRGLNVPYMYLKSTHNAPEPHRVLGLAEPEPASVAPRSAVSLLTELCETYRLPAPEYELIGDTGPPHSRHFTMRGKVGVQEQVATSTTKKAARQLVAEKLYNYLRSNLSLTMDFEEQEALVRAHEKVMQRYTEKKGGISKPSMSQKICDYHMALLNTTEEEKITDALKVLNATAGYTPYEILTIVSTILELNIIETELDSVKNSSIQSFKVIQLRPTCPEMTFIGFSQSDAAQNAVNYLRTALTRV